MEERESMKSVPDSVRVSRTPCNFDIHFSHCGVGCCGVGTVVVILEKEFRPDPTLCP